MIFFEDDVADDDDDVSCDDPFDDPELHVHDITYASVVPLLLQ